MYIVICIVYTWNMNRNLDHLRYQRFLMAVFKSLNCHCLNQCHGVTGYSLAIFLVAPITADKSQNCFIFGPQQTTQPGRFSITHPGWVPVC
jgi:hypothetical protein